METVLDGTDIKAGMTCLDELAPNVMFLSVSKALPTMMAHEIGHALSLKHSGVENLAFGNFEEKNIMHDSDNASLTSPRAVLTLGQMYRVYVDDRSWLNAPVGGAPARRNAPTKHCQDGYSTTGPCPPTDQAWP